MYRCNTVGSTHTGAIMHISTTSSVSLVLAPVVFLLCSISLDLYRLICTMTPTANHPVHRATTTPLLTTAHLSAPPLPLTTAHCLHHHHCSMQHHHCSPLRTFLHHHYCSPLLTSLHHHRHCSPQLTSSWPGSSCTSSFQGTSKVHFLPSTLNSNGTLIGCIINAIRRLFP